MLITFNKTYHLASNLFIFILMSKVTKTTKQIKADPSHSEDPILASNTSVLDRPTIEIVDKRIFNGPAFKYDDPAVLRERIEDYFTTIKEENRPATMSGLALHLNISRPTLANYEKHYPLNSNLFGAIKMARARVEASLDEKLVSGMPATGMIFNLKNNFGWKDQHQLDVTSNGASVFDNESLRLASQEILSSIDEPKGEDTP